MREELRKYWDTATHLSSNMRLLLIGTALLGFGNTIFSTFLNLYIQKGGLGTAFIGRLNSLGTIGTLAFAIPAGIFVGKLGDRWSLTLSILLMGIMSILQVSTLVPLVLIIIQISCSALNMLYNAAFNPEIMQSTSAQDRRIAFSLAFSAGTIASVFACLIGGLLPHMFQQLGATTFMSLRLTLIIAAFLVTSSSCVFAQVRDHPLRAADQEYREEGDICITDDAPGWRHSAVQYIVAQVIIGLGAGLSIPYLNLYFVDRFHAGTVMVGNLFAVSNVVLSICGLLAPILARRIGPLWTVLLTNGISPLFLVIMAFTRNTALAAVAFWIRSGLMMCSNPIINQFCLELVPEHRRSVAQNVFQMAWTGAWAVSAAIGGWMIQKSGYTVPMLLTAACYLVYVVVFACFFRSHPAMQKARAAGAGILEN